MCFVQSESQLSVYLSGNGSEWVNITDALELHKSEKADFAATITDVSAWMRRAGVQRDVYLRVRSAAHASANWVAGIRSVVLGDLFPSDTPQLTEPAVQPARR
jgi:hypothetical protein